MPARGARVRMSAASSRLLEHQDRQPDQTSPDDAMQTGTQQESGRGLAALRLQWGRRGECAFRPGENDRARVVTVAEAVPEQQHHVDAPRPQQNDRHLWRPERYESNVGANHDREPFRARGRRPAPSIWLAARSGGPLRGGWLGDELLREDQLIGLGDTQSVLLAA